MRLLRWVLRGFPKCHYCLRPIKSKNWYFVDWFSGMSLMCEHCRAAGKKPVDGKVYFMKDLLQFIKIVICFSEYLSNYLLANAIFIARRFIASKFIPVKYTHPFTYKGKDYVFETTIIVKEVDANEVKKVLFASNPVSDV